MSWEVSAGAELYVGTQKCSSFVAELVLPKRSSCTLLNVRCLWAIFPQSFPKHASGKPQGQRWSHVQTGRYWQSDLLWLDPCLYNTKEGNSPCTKGMQHFHWNAGQKDSRQFVCGHKAAHLRQKGKLYQCNFPRQTRHKSERPFPSPASSFPLAAASSAHSFPPLPPSPPLLSLPTARPIHGHPLKCPICRESCSACFHFQLLDILSQGPSFW